MGLLNSNDEQTLPDTQESNIHLASQLEPKKAIEDGKLADETGLDFGFVTRNRDKALSFKRKQNIDLPKLKVESPKTHDWLSKYRNAAISIDDVHHLSALERTLTPAAAVVKSAASLAEGTLRLPQAAEDALHLAARFTENATGLPKMFDPLRGLQTIASGYRMAITPAAEGYSELNSLLTDISPSFQNVNDINKQGDAAVKSLLNGDASPMLEVLSKPEALPTALASAIPSLYAAIKTGGGLAPMMAMEGGSELNSIADAQKHGTDVPLEQRVQAFGQTALINGLLEKVGLDLFRKVPQIGKLLGDKKTDDISGLDVLKVALGETGTELLQNLNQNVAEKITYEPHKDLLEGSFGSAFGGFLAGGSVAGSSHLISRLGKHIESKAVENIIEGQKAVEGKQTLDAAVETAGKTNLAKMDSESFRKFVEHVDAESVSLSAEDAGTFFQSHPEAAQALEKSHPEVYAQLAESSVTGSNVTMEYHSELVDDIRVGDNAMSFNDYQNAADDLQNEVESEAKKVIDSASSEFTSSLANVKSSFLQSLNDAGRFSKDVNEKYAALNTNIVATLAHRTGMQPEEFAKKYKLIATTPEYSQVQQAERAGYVDQLIYKMRSDTLPSDSEVYGDSLIEFLRSKGGIQNQGGELSARDINQATGKKFKKNLMSDKGLTLDGAAELAAEAGYIDERDINKMLDAIDSEVQGEPVYSPFDTNHELEQQLKDAYDIQQKIGNKDLGNMSNADIQALLGEGDYYQSQAKEYGITEEEARKQYEDVVAKYKDTDQWMKAPNGEPTKLNERQWVQTRTPAFKKWFGDWEKAPDKASKVVDENGEPLVVYHGTNKDFDRFKGDIHFFTRYEETADIYARIGGNIIPAFINSKTPFDTREPDAEDIFDSGFYRQWGNGAPLDPSDNLPDWSDAEDFKEFFDENEYPYDSVYIHEPQGNESLAVFNPNQIKSATGNTGQFDAKNDNILYQSGNAHKPLVAEAELEGKSTKEQLALLDAAYPQEASQLEGRRHVVRLIKLKRLNKTGSMEQQEAEDTLTKRIKVAEDPKETAFKKWFGNSVVVDDKGKPKVVYHGTGAKVTDSFIFDYSRLGEHGTSEGAGFYFTENGEIADSYNNDGSTLDVYLSIKKPLAYDADGFSHHELKKILKAFAKSEAEQDEMDIEDGFLSNYADVRRTGIDAAISDAADSLMGVKAIDQIGSLIINNTDTEIINRAVYDVTGYDGIVSDGFANQGGDKIYVAFFPEQIKSTKAIKYDSSNPDIFFQKHLGSIQFPQGELDSAPSIINIMESANLSTVIHEMGHFYFEVMNHIATQPDAPKGVVDDMNTLLDFAGVESIESWNMMSIEERRAAHEKTAEAFERYIMEGKAPSRKLRELFQTLKSWMLTAYRGITNKHAINDDVRAVFDRMVASEDEIAQAQKDLQAFAMFESAEDAGMTDAEYADYLKQQEQLKATAEDALSGDMIHDMQWLEGAQNKALKALQREQASKRRAMKEEVTADIYAQPVYQAWHLLTKGTLPNGELPDGITAAKFNTNDLKGMYGKDADALWHAIPNNMKSKDGIHPDIVAAWFGFNSGDDLILKITSSPKPQDAIKNETEKRLLERYGTIKDGEQLKVAAMEALHNQAHEKMLRTEYKAMNKIVGKQDKLNRKAVSDYAAAKIGSMNVGAIKPYQFLAAERKAAKASSIAFGKGDVEEAAKQKRIQIIQRALYSAANKAVKEKESIERYLKGFERKAVRRKLEASYLDQVKELLNKYDFRKATQKDVNTREGLIDWMLREKTRTGVEPQIPSKVLMRAKKIHYTKVSMDELRALKTAVKEIDYYGRFKKKLLDAKHDRELADAVNDAVLSMTENNELDFSEVPYNKSLVGNLMDGAAKKGSALLNVEMLIRRLDGDKLGGLWHTLFLPLSEASDRALARKAEAAKYFRELIQSTYGVKERARMSGVGAKIYKIDGIKGGLTKEQIITFAMNYGNAEGRNRLEHGNKFTDAQLQQMFSHIESKDIAFMEAMWRYSDENIWDDLAKLERDIHGEAPEKVEAMPFEINGVKVRGGYFPLKYDRQRGEIEKNLDDKKALEDFTNGFTSRAATKQGAAKDRVENLGAAVRSDLGVFAEGINDAIHDVEMRRAVIDANRIIHDKSFAKTFKAAAGNHPYDLLKPWLQDIAVPPEAPQDGISKWVAKTRSNSAVVAMGLSFKTAWVNLSGILQSMDANDVGAGRIAWWNAKLAANPTHWKKQMAFITARSPYMKTRAAAFDRDVQESMRSMSVRGTLTPKSSSYFYLLSLSDKAVAVPTWMAAYEKAMAENGNDEVKAVQFADHTIRSTQGSGRDIDLSMIQRGKPGNRELYKAFTMFYSYFNTTLNRNIRAVHLLKKNGIKGTPQFIASMMFINILPAIIGAYMSGYGPDDDEEWFGWAALEVAKFGTGQLPFVRDIAGYYANQVADKFTYMSLRATPLEGAFQEMFMGPYRVASDLIDGEADEKTLKEGILSTGYWFGLPSRQIWRTSEHLIHTMDGTSDFSPVDLLMGESHHK